MTNSRRQLHAVYRSAGAGAACSRDARPDFAAALGTSYTGWGASWADLDLDGNLDLVLANGAIPVTDLAKDAQRIQVLDNRDASPPSAEFADARPLVGAPRTAAVERPRRSPRPTTTTTATSTSPSTRSAAG